MSQFKGTANIVSYEDHMIVPHDDGRGWDILIRFASDEIRKVTYNYDTDGNLYSYHTEGPSLIYNRYFAFEGGALASNVGELKQGMGFGGYDYYYHYDQNGRIEEVSYLDEAFEFY